MSLEPDITFEGEFVLFRYTGPDSFQISIEQMTQLAKACEDFRCFKILGVTEFSNPLNTMEAYDYQYIFEEAGITHKYRIAWVEKNPEARKMIKFIETVLRNRGLEVRLFSDVVEAKQWLLGDQ